MRYLDVKTACPTASPPPIPRHQGGHTVGQISSNPRGLTTCRGPRISLSHMKTGRAPPPPNAGHTPQPRGAAFHRTDTRRGMAWKGEGGPPRPVNHG
jgi:hypothetical protein